MQHWSPGFSSGHLALPSWLANACPGSVNVQWGPRFMLLWDDDLPARRQQGTPAPALTELLEKNRRRTLSVLGLMDEMDLKPAWVDRGPGHTPWAAAEALGSGNRNEPICQAPSQAVCWVKRQDFSIHPCSLEA